VLFNPSFNLRIGAKKGKKQIVGVGQNIKASVAKI
jgi:hypothetical protein